MPWAGLEPQTLGAASGGGNHYAMLLLDLLLILNKVLKFFSKINIFWLVEEKTCFEIVNWKEIGIYWLLRQSWFKRLIIQNIGVAILNLGYRSLYGVYQKFQGIPLI